jgi:hypothetical protein
VIEQSVTDANLKALCSRLRRTADEAAEAKGADHFTPVIK